MDKAALGSRIKEARLAKKLTQAEVVGNFITRNMLSQIESGTAAPSIKTLTYLAEVLDLPIEQLIGAEEPGDLSLLAELKQALDLPKAFYASPGKALFEAVRKGNFCPIAPIPRCVLRC